MNGIGDQQAAATATAAGADRGSIEVELFVRAGKDGETLGGCPVCHRFFMLLLTKAEYHPEMSLVVTTVNPARNLPDILREQGATTRLPVLRYGDEIVSDPDEMLGLIDRLFHYPPMNYDSAPAARACRDVFSKFSFYVKAVSHTSDTLLAELVRLDQYLQETGARYLSRDLPDHLDCLTLPKLQIIRVVAKALKDFDIPAELRGVWRYLAAAYDTPAFRNSCPSDQEIVDLWQSKPECPNLSRQAAAYYSTATPARHSFDVPPGTPTPPALKA
jgi:hypothetical protein